MLKLSFEMIILIALSSCFGALCGYFIRKLFDKGTAHERAIIAASKAQTLEEKQHENENIVK